MNLTNCERDHTMAHLGPLAQGVGENKLARATPEVVGRATTCADRAAGRPLLEVAPCGDTAQHHAHARRHRAHTAQVRAPSITPDTARRARSFSLPAVLDTGRHVQTASVLVPLLNKNLTKKVKDNPSVVIAGA